MKVPRRSLFALAVGFFFPGFRADPDPAPPSPDLRLTKKPAEDSIALSPGEIHYLQDGEVFPAPPEYICPIHGDIGIHVVRYEFPAKGINEAFCLFCTLDQLRKLPIARLASSPATSITR